MTELLERALNPVRRLPPHAQDVVAEAILSLADIGAPDDATVDVEPEHLAAVTEGLAQAERGEFATDEEVASAFRSFER